jgi:hypothetical protein
MCDSTRTLKQTVKGTILKLYEVRTITTLLYGNETWVKKNKIYNNIQAAKIRFHTVVLRIVTARNRLPEPLSTHGILTRRKNLSIFKDIFYHLLLNSYCLHSDWAFTKTKIYIRNFFPPRFLSHLSIFPQTPEAQLRTLRSHRCAEIENLSYTFVGNYQRYGGNYCLHRHENSRRQLLGQQRLRGTDGPHCLPWAWKR